MSNNGLKRLNIVNHSLFFLCRVVLALTFIFSGFVKAIDPIGTQYKIQDYAEAAGYGSFLNDTVTLSASVLLATMEFAMGMFLLFAIYRRFVSRLMVLFMLVMTVVTVWIYVADPVSDCGCFGDAIVLSNGETLLKNIILLAMSLVVAWKPLNMVRFVSLSNQWIVFHYTFVFILGLSVWCLYDLPIFDFRPYHLGANIQQDMEIPEGAEQPKFETYFILEKDGVRKEFTLDEYPDSTWTFIDSRTEQITKGYVPPIHDFSMTSLDDSEDFTEEILSHPGYTFLLISPHLENADDSTFGNIDIIYEYASDNGYPFYCLTASGDSAIAHWRDITGAEYQFLHTDDVTLKTIIRSNPGLLLLKDGTVIGKWSHNFLPVDDFLAAPLEKSEMGKLHDDGNTKRVVMILLWFVLPLVLLTIADRLWFWSRWLKQKEEKIIQVSQAQYESEDRSRDEIEDKSKDKLS